MMLISNHIILRMKKNLFDSIVYYIGGGVEGESCHIRLKGDFNPGTVLCT